jgi:hypothetical protein
MRMHWCQAREGVLPPLLLFRQTPAYHAAFSGTRGGCAAVEKLGPKSKSSPACSGSTPRRHTLANLPTLSHLQLSCVRERGGDCFRNVSVRAHWCSPNRVLRPVPVNLPGKRAIGLPPLVAGPSLQHCCWLCPANCSHMGNRGGACAIHS